jgi:hypothetical protein
MLHSHGKALHFKAATLDDSSSLFRGTPVSFERLATMLALGHDSTQHC